LIKQSNFFGDNIINYQISIDVERLQEIVYEETPKVKQLLNTLTSGEKSTITDNSAIKIDKKNIQNELIDFYDSFIKKQESKIEVLEKFVIDNSLYDNIDSASDTLKLFIYSHQDRESHKLTPDIFNILIQEHTKGLKGDDKDVMKLLLFFLYRECFIGDK
jgi:hypothetical protein